MSKLEKLIIQNKLYVSILIGIVSGLLSYFLLSQRGFLASDFQWSLRAGQYILEGINPYYQTPNNFQYPYDSPFFYPLPTAIFSILFSPFEPYMAAALFFGLSSFVLAIAILNNDYSKLPVFLSAPFFINASVAQWTPLILSIAFLPKSFGFLAFLKPSQGLVSFIYKPTLKAIIIYGCISIFTLLIFPTWPFDWINLLKENRNVPIIFTTFGPILIFSLISIKKKEGRTFIAMLLIPRHHYWYDSLMVWLIPKTFKQSLFLSALSWIAYISWFVFSKKYPMFYPFPDWDLQVLLIYLPAMFLLIIPTIKPFLKKVKSMINSLFHRGEK